MKILALDLSTNTGFAVLEDGKLLDYGCVSVDVPGFNVNNYPEKDPLYPENIIKAADDMGRMVLSIYFKYMPDQVLIENTVRGKNRHTQRILEFIHKSVLDNLIKECKVHALYRDPSEWRSKVGLYLSKEDKKNNALVSKGIIRGRITRKHLAVRMANELFKLELKIKDNDIADSILLGLSYFK